MRLSCLKNGGKTHRKEKHGERKDGLNHGIHVNLIRGDMSTKAQTLNSLGGSIKQTK